MVVPQKQCFEAMKTAREEMMSITAQRRIREALKAHTRKSQPFVPEEGQQVLVYREGTKSFEGPFIVHAYDNRKTVQLLVPNAAGQVKVVSFSLSAVKPLPLPSNPNADAAIDSATTTAETAGRADYRVLENALTLSELDTPVSGHEDVIEQLNSLQHSAYPVQIVQDTGPQVFQEEKKAELLQLLQKGTYEIVPANDIPTWFCRSWVSFCSRREGTRLRKSQAQSRASLFSVTRTLRKEELCMRPQLS